MAHVALVAAVICHRGAQIFMLILNRNAAFPTPYHRLALLGAVAELARVLANQLLQNGGFTVVGGQGQRLKGFQH